MQVQIFDDPAIAMVDPTTYAAFVGRYENTSGVVDLITRRGDKLFGQEAKEDTPTELLPESSDTFFIPGDPARITFVRDQPGKVVGMVVHIPDREVRRERKVTRAVGTKPDAHEKYGIWCSLKECDPSRIVSWEMNPILTQCRDAAEELYDCNLDEEMGRNSSGCSRR